MSAAKIRPQIRAQSARARGSLPAQPPGQGLLQMIYFSPAASLLLVHVLQFLITSEELIWDSLSPCWRVSRGLTGQAGPCHASCSGAGGCPGSPSSRGSFAHPTANCKQPDAKERAGFSFAGIVVLEQRGGGLSQRGLCEPSHASWGCSEKGEAPHACVTRVFTSAVA